MQKYFVIAFKVLVDIRRHVSYPFWQLFTRLLLYCNGVQIGSFKTKGIPFIDVSRNGHCVIGNQFNINNIVRANPIGRSQRSILSVSNGAKLEIGNNVGMSFVAINCKLSIMIGDNVMLGGGVCIYDSDFHPLNTMDRTLRINENTNKRPVVIGNNVFVGAHSTILKGCNIGDNAIIGACSVVTKSIPANEIWAGNPAKFVKAI